MEDTDEASSGAELSVEASESADKAQSADSTEADGGGMEIRLASRDNTSHTPG